MNQTRRTFANPLLDLVGSAALLAAIGIAVYYWFGAGDASFSMSAFYRTFRELHHNGTVFYPLVVVGVACLWFRPGTGQRRVG